MKQIARVYLRGVPFDPCTKKQALAIAAEALTREYSAPPLTVVTPNAVIAGKCLAQPELSRLLVRASLCLPDGAGTVLASHILPRKNNDDAGGKPAVSPFPERVAGIDFGYGVLSLAAAGGYPVFLLGGAPGVADAAAERLREQLPGLSVTGTCDGYFDPDCPGEISRILDSVRASRANILIVCIGFPKQERFLLRYADTLPDVKIAAGLGGSLDVWAGKFRRAPEWMRGAKLEWLYRVCREPGRIPELGYAARFLFACRRESHNLHRIPKNNPAK